MLPFHGDSADTSQTFSSSYIGLRSASDRLSLKRLTAQRSRTGRLSHENYILWRDRQLLEKLVRNKALYDAVRNQLLSQSNISVDRKFGNEDHVEAEDSSNMSAMVDLAHKGTVLGPRKQIGCCSCCSSKCRLREHVKKRRRRKRFHGDGYIIFNPSTDSIKGSANKFICNAKQVKSEPCTCTFKFETLMQKRPKGHKEHSFLGAIDEHKRKKRNLSCSEFMDSDICISSISRNLYSITKTQQPRIMKQNLINTSKGKPYKQNIKIANYKRKLSSYANTQWEKNIIRDRCPMLDLVKISSCNILNKRLYLCETNSGIALKDTPETCLETEYLKLGINKTDSSSPCDTFIDVDTEPLESMRKSHTEVTEEDLLKPKHCSKYSTVPEDTNRILIGHSSNIVSISQPRKIYCSINKIRPILKSSDTYYSGYYKKTTQDDAAATKIKPCKKNMNDLRSSGARALKRCSCFAKIKPIVKSNKYKACNCDRLPKTVKSTEASSFICTPLSCIEHSFNYLPRKIEKLNDARTSCNIIRLDQSHEKYKRYSKNNLNSPSEKEQISNDLPAQSSTSILLIAKSENKPIHTQQDAKFENHKQNNFVSGLRSNSLDDSLKLPKPSEEQRTLIKTTHAPIKYKLRKCFCTLKLEIPKKTVKKTGSKVSLIKAGSRQDSKKIYVKSVTETPNEEHTLLIGPKIEEEQETEVFPDVEKLPVKISLNCEDHCQEICRPNKVSPITKEMYPSYENVKENDLPHIKQNKVMCPLVREFTKSTEHQNIIVVIKIEKKEKCMRIGRTVKRCLCTLKLHKNGRNTRSDNVEHIETQSNEVTNKIYLENNERRGEVLGENTKSVSASVDMLKKCCTSKAMITTPQLKEKQTATKNCRRTQKSQYTVKMRNKMVGIKPKLKKCFCTSKFLKEDNRTNTNLKFLNQFKYQKPINVYTLSRVTPSKNLGRKKYLLQVTTSFRLGSCYALKTTSSQNQNHENEYLSSLVSMSTIEIRSHTMSYFQQSLFLSHISRLNLATRSTDNLSSRRIVRFRSKLGFGLQCLQTKNRMTSRNYSNSLASPISKTNFTNFKNTNLNDPMYATAKINKTLRVTGRKPLFYNTGISPYLKRHYCTWNIQVSGRTDKLKSYECEPGICIPYECDPNECQKLIMKRVMRKVNTRSGTELRLKKNASSTLGSETRNRELQSSSRRKPKKDIKIQPKSFTFDTRPSRRQAVRVGSSYSFNIQFSKDQLKPKAVRLKEQKPYTSPKNDGRKNKTECTRGIRPNRHDMESQSVVKKLRHRSSGAMMKKCFCTLKLQKKGREQIVHSLNVSHGTSTPPEVQYTSIATDASQNTKLVKRVKQPKLLPYECEIGKCVPGECNPYECLELINKRLNKNKGTNSIKSNISSNSSMTTKQKLQTRGKYVQLHKKKRAKSAESRLEKTSQKSSRQAVRIGSSFSFNVEFFKDNALINLEQRRPSQVSCDEKKKITTHRKIKKHTARKIKNTSSQDSVSTRHRYSQIGLLNRPYQAYSTITPSLLQRCFCTLKHFSGGTGNKVARSKANIKENVNVKPVALPTQTPKRHDLHILKPNEYKPDISVPGLCECKKIIKNRKTSKTSNTDKVRTKSISSTYKSSKTSKAGITQVGRLKHHIPKKAYTIEKPCKVDPPQKQVVRIGSSFSFNIEFYKDQFQKTGQVQAAAEMVKCKQKKSKADDTKSGPENREKALQSKYISSHRREFQADTPKRGEHRASGVRPMLKRCLCTLKLQRHKDLTRKTRDTVVFTNQGTETPLTKNIATLRNKSVMVANKINPFAYNLLPYECEPNICTPGSCDPYECEKLIKRRLKNKAASTPTKRQRTRSVSSSVKRRRNVQNNPAHLAKKQHKMKEKQFETTKSHDTDCRPSKQAVSIGSTFSFNVEFYKDRSPGGIKVSSSPAKQSPEKKYKKLSSSTTSPAIKFQYNKAPSTKSRRDKISQVKANKMRPTTTGVTPFLKNCLCTLKSLKQKKSGLEFNKNFEKPNTNAVNKNVGTNRTSAWKEKRNLEPSECEGGVCVTGQCDRYDCRKRIKARKHSKLSGTDREKARSVSSITSKTTIAKERKIQAVALDKPRKSSNGDDLVRQPKEIPRETYNNDPSRQAVRVGSCFSFNIEFYKDNSPCVPVCAPARKPICENVSKPVRQKKSQSTKIYSDDDGGFLHTPSRSQGTKSESRGSGTGRILKRCFCTLKLQKIGHQQLHIPQKDNTNARHIGTSTPTKNRIEVVTIAAREVGTKTKKIHRSPEPYECEPGVCNPGMCDPYKCLERIKKREMRSLGTKTMRTAMRSISSLTSKNRAQSIITQPIKTGKRKKSSIVSKNIRDRFPRPSRAVENINRQAVRLGSSFSFNIEFHKDRSPQCDKPLQERQAEPAVTKFPMQLERHKSVFSVPTSKLSERKNKTPVHKGFRHHKQLQSPGVKTESKGSGMGPLLKRCFCTLTLQRASVHYTNKSEIESILNNKMKKLIKQSVEDSSEAQTINICKKNNSYDYKSQVPPRQSNSPKKNIERFNCSIVHRVQLEKKNVPKFIQPHIKEIENSTHLRYSSYNKADLNSIQINNDYLEQTNVSISPISNRQRSYNKYDYDKTGNKHHGRCSYQIIAKRDNKACSFGNLFKSCFSLSKPNHEIEKLRCPKTAACGEVNQTRTPIPHLHQNYYELYKSQNQKGIKTYGVKNAIHCGENKEKQRDENLSQMETIMPHNPGKFEKISNTATNIDKSFEKRRVKFGKESSLATCPKDLPKISSSINANNLTNDERKKSALDNIKDEKRKPAFFKQLIFRCFQVFSKRNKLVSTKYENTKTATLNKHGVPLRAGDILKSSKSERRSKVFDVRISPKKSKSLKATTVSEKDKDLNKKKIFSKFQAGDVHNVNYLQGVNRTNELTKICQKERKNIVTFENFHNKLRDLSHQSEEKKRQFNGVSCIRMCDCCGGFKINKTSHTLNHTSFKPLNSLKDYKGNLTKKTQSQDSLKHQKNTYDSAIQCPKFSVYFALQQKQYSPIKATKTCHCVRRCVCPKRKLNSRIKSCHCIGKCTCCICTQPKSVTPVNTTKPINKCACGSRVCSKEFEKLNKTKEMERPIKQSPTQSKPCVCGSQICKTETRKLLEQSKTKGKGKAEQNGTGKKQDKSICGCTFTLKKDQSAKKREVARRQAELRAQKKQELTNKQQELVKKRQELAKKQKTQRDKKRKIEKKRRAKQKRKAYLERLKRYKKEDEIRRIQRKEYDKKMLKNLKKYKNSGDCMLITESVLDVAKLGLVSAGDIIRCSTKAAIDPKQTALTVGRNIANPARAWTKLKHTADQSPGISTLKRVRWRLSQTSLFKKGKDVLESHPVTDFLIHPTDVKGRQVRRRLRRRRPRVDFQCSPYMLSLRKKPCLSIYLSCPWFYPHCMSLVQLWRQFSDVMLFLFAITVWCPCLLAMEACRAITFCCFCAR